MPLDLTHVASDTQISDEEIITAFATLMAAMRQRRIIRTKNVVGDLGERYAELIYRTHSQRGPITLVDTNSMDVDAKDSTGALYSIKTASPSTTRTGAFHLEKDHRDDNKAFDYLIVVRVNDLLQPAGVFEFTWNSFWNAKQWNIREKAWFLPLSQKALSQGKCLFTLADAKR
jgi:hypothetical protein